MIGLFQGVQPIKIRAQAYNTPTPRVFQRDKQAESVN